MKIKKIGSVLAVLILFSLFIVVGIVVHTYSNSSAAVVDQVTKEILIPTMNSDYAVGTKDNPFVVLEIVPYEGYAEFGYLIDGQEPVDMEVLSYANDYSGNIESLKTYDIIKKDNFSTFKPSAAMQKAGKFTTSIAKQYGYYVNASKGDYIKIRVNRKYEYRYVSDKSGNYNWVGLDVGENKEEGKIYVEKESTLFSCNRVWYKSKNIFLKECMKLTDEQIPNYNIQVMTVTSEQINQNLGLIDRANLIYINCKMHNGEKLQEIWMDDRFARNDLFTYKEELGNKPEVRFTSPERDLSWEAVVKIIQKKSGCDLPEGVNPCPIIYDLEALERVPTVQMTLSKKTNNNQVITDNQAVASNNNVYKLGLMIRQMDTKDLYDFYFKTGRIETVTRVDGMTTGKFKDFDNASLGTFWAPMTLIPYHKVDLINYDYNKMWNDLKVAGFPRLYGFDDTELAGDSAFMYKGDNSIGMRFTEDSVGYHNDYSIEAFEFYDMNSGNLSPAEVIYFLLNQKKAGENRLKFSILEIQPIPEYKMQEQWDDFIKNMLPGFGGTPTVERMTTKEFICRVEELVGTYDLIYIGMNTSTITKNQKFDLADDSWAYSHVGKKIEIKHENYMAGWIKGKASNFNARFSGNDITKLKMNQLLEYVDTGYPILLASGMMSGDIISNKIDSSSYVHSLLSTLKSSPYVSKVMREDTVTKDQFSNLINSTTCDVTFTELPTPYQDVITAKEKKPSDPTPEVYINSGAGDDRTLFYEFTITDDGTDSFYEVSLCLDRNADGIFTKVAGKNNEELEINSIIDKVNKTTVPPDQLRAGTVYQIKKDLNDNSGVLTWQFSVEKLHKEGGALVPTGMKFNKTGISAIKKKRTDEHKEPIMVLQIASDNPSVYLPTDSEIKTAGVTDKTPLNDVKNAFKDKIKGGLSANQSINMGLFYYYIINLQDYDIHFERYTVSQYEEKIKNNLINLDSYQMLILGFADMYSDIKTEKGRTAIETFIKKGRTVLFTHDTTFFSAENQLTVAFREYFGMDRFGTLYMRKSETFPTAEWLNSKGKDLNFKPDSLQDLDQVELEESYGFTNQQLRRYAKVSDNVANFNNDILTTNVTNINQGQITDYPYDIPKNINVLSTHYQYFQLDMENPDIVVWYSLANNNTTTNGPYEINDGRNGYYIYNKGNLTYSGAGHTPGSIGIMPVEEVKLFVNTIIAAYRATPLPTEIEILNTDKSTDKNKKDYLLIDYDFQDTTKAIGNGADTADTKRIYFLLTNNTSFSNSNLKIKYYIADYTVEPTIMSEENLKTFHEGGTEVANDKVITDTIYYIDVPLDTLLQYSYMDIAMELELTYKDEDDITQTLSSVKKAQLIRRGLFNLD